MNTRTPKCTPALRVKAVILTPEKREFHHELKFNYADLNERWCFNVRMEECLAQGYAIGIEKLDPRAERLAAKFPMHG